MLTAAVRLSMADVRLHVCAFARLRNQNIIREAALSNTATKALASSPGISRRDLAVMTATAAAYSRRLSRSLKLSRSEEADAEQDILVMLLERWHYFDDSRGSNIGFAIRIARQAAHVIATRLVAGWERNMISFDLPPDVETPCLDGEDLTLADILPDDTSPSEASIVMSVSMAHFVDGLPEELAILAHAIREQDGDLGEAQRHSQLSSSEFHRRLRELRYRLVSLELAPRAWLNYQ